MSEAYLVRRGGGATDAYAAIQVQYTPGVAVSVSNGTKTFRPKDNIGGLWVCSIPSAGTWTVTAGSKTKTVSITQEGQVEIVNLAVLTLYSPGDEHSSTTGGWKVYQNATISRQTTQLKITPTRQYDGNQALVGPTNMIDLTDINVLYAEAKNNCSEDEYLGFSVYDANLTQKASVWWDANQNATKSLNVSKLSGTYYVGFEVYWGVTYKGDGRIYNVWGE